MRTLILMRHAKSSWDDPFLPDHDRPLNKRGKASARAMGEWLRARGHLPDQALISSSRRTVDTFAGLTLDCPAEATRTLYHAAPSGMLDVLQSATGNTVLMLGHNPGIASFAEALVAAPPDHARFDDFPTAATLVAQFPVDAWHDAMPGTAKMMDFAIPREVLGD